MSATTPLDNPPPNSAALRELRFEIEEFNAEYAAVLDALRIEAWPGFFTEDGFYLVTAKENADSGLPVGLVYCEGMGMLKDRAFAIAKTAMFAPRYLRHFISNARVLSVADDGTIAAEANYMVLQTLADEPTTVHQAGCYRDRFRRGADGRLRLQERRCIYDSVLIDNALVFPV
jgi:3-phenylpropionate/cinnamic acid dioxygenase small subunit